MSHHSQPSFPPIPEVSDEGEDSDYDYRTQGVVKALGRTDLEEDSGDGLDELYEKLSIKSKTTDTGDQKGPGARVSRRSSVADVMSAPASPSSQRRGSPQTRNAQEASSSSSSSGRTNDKRPATQQSPNITRKAGEAASILG
jgi:hypothetical protein